MRGSKAVRAGAFAAALAMAACKEFHLSASNLEIGPNPAVPGDVVVASFVVTLAPLQRHTIRVIIDSTEHVAVTSTERPPIPYVLTLGDAADLISAYGEGTHSAHIVVRAEDADRTARTQSFSFELRQAAP